MRIGSRLLLACVAGAVLLAIGCQRWRERWRNRDPYSAYPNDPFFQRRDQYPPGYPAPYPYYGPPPTGVPVAPVPQGATTPPPEVLTPQPPPAEVKPPSSSMYRPPTGATAPSAVPSPQRAPSTAEPPLAQAQPVPKKTSPTREYPSLPPDLVEKKSNDPAATIPTPNVPEKPWGLPVGIPFYFEVKEGIAATGHRPDPEGLDWLKSRGFQTVLQLRKPGADPSSDRQQIEKRGLHYLDLEVSAATFGRTLLEDFTRILQDKSKQPVFVYDADGTLAGPMWYAYLRLVEKLPADLARSRAELYGFKETGTQERVALAEAVKILLEKDP